MKWGLMKRSRIKWYRNNERITENVCKKSSPSHIYSRWWRRVWGDAISKPWNARAGGDPEADSVWSLTAWMWIQMPKQVLKHHVNICSAVCGPEVLMPMHFGCLETFFFKIYCRCLDVDVLARLKVYYHYWWPKLLCQAECAYVFSWY